MTARRPAAVRELTRVVAQLTAALRLATAPARDEGAPRDDPSTH